MVMLDPGWLQVVLLRCDGGPPGMEGSVIAESWAYVDQTDKLDISWNELTRELEAATTPGDRDVHIEIDQFDWGASGPLEVAYRIAMDFGFEVALLAVTAWVKSRLGGVKGALKDVESATAHAVRHLKRYHDANYPIVEEATRTEGSVDLLIRDGHQRFRVQVRGKDALIVTAELIR